MKPAALGPGQNDDLGKICKEMIEKTLRDGHIKGANKIVKNVYKQRLGRPSKGHAPSFKPEVQDRVAAMGILS